MKDLRWIIREILPFWPRILLALLLSTLTISSHIGLMVTSSYLLARAALQPPILDLMVAIVGVRFFGIARAVFRYLERLVSHDLTFRVVSRLRVLVYQEIEPLAPAQLVEFRSGDLLSRIVGDVEVQQNLFLKILAPPIVAILVLLGYGGFLAGFDQRLSFLLAGFFLAAGVVIPFLIRALSRDAGSHRVKAKARLHILILDMLQGMPELLMFGQSETILQNVQDVQNELSQADRKLAKASGISNALMGVTMNLGMWCVLVLGIVLVEKGQLNGLYLGMLALGVLSSFEAVTPIPASLQQLEENQAAGKRLRLTKQGKGNLRKEKENGTDLGILDRGEISKLLPPVPEELGIEFREVSFRYNQEEPWALEDISLNIPYQKRVGIVGQSGAGKSSLVNLLLRFWDFEQGEIRLGGFNLKDFDPDDVRAQFGVVTQRTHLFHATVKENLLLAKPEATDEELYEATQRAQIHDFILSLPQGYDSLIGEEGMKLSGGQQQRLAIARVLLKNAPILILDEATNGLDPVTERDVLEEIYSLMQGRTTLVISHHLWAIKDMDEIYVLDQGKVVERGRHEMLLAQKGFYRKLWEGTDE